MDKKMKRIIWFAILLSAIVILCNIYQFVLQLCNMKTIGSMNTFLDNFLFTISLFILLIMCSNMIAKGVVFTKGLRIQGSVLSWVFLLASIVFPRIDKYEVHYQFLAWGKFVLIDGKLFVLGLIFLILDYIFCVGDIQREDIESIL